MGYHLKRIDKGVFGEFSKITEEFEELMDANLQNNKVLELVELCDLLGAIEAYVKHNNLTLMDLVKMKNATKRAFESGERK